MARTSAEAGSKGTTSPGPARLVPLYHGLLRNRRGGGTGDEEGREQPCAGEGRPASYRRGESADGWP